MINAPIGNNLVGINTTPGINKSEKLDYKALGIKSLDIASEESVAMQDRERMKEGISTGDFMKLFIAQLQNQDPLDPQEGAEFISQLAQLTLVEGNSRLEQSVAKMVKSIEGSHALQATSLVGQAVDVKSDKFINEHNKITTGLIDVPQNVEELTISIQDSSGTEVHTIQLGSQSQGQVPFQWDGRDKEGHKLKEGSYKAVAHALVNGEKETLDTIIKSTVQSVSVNSDGKVILNVKGAGSFSMEELTGVSKQTFINDTSLQSSRALQATSMIGRTVDVKTADVLNKNGHAVSGKINLPMSVDELVISVRNSNGNILKIDSLGEKSTGVVDFIWDGTDQYGKKLPDGEYNIVATTRIGEDIDVAETIFTSKVDSVSIEPRTGELTLHFPTISSIGISDVHKIYDSGEKL